MTEVGIEVENVLPLKMASVQVLEPDGFYHIYNRGINSETIFKEERNYRYFLDKYNLYLSPVVNTFAYCLLGNHFHLLIQVKEQAKLDVFSKELKLTHKEGLHSPDFIVSKQFAKLFSSYTQAINRAFGRTGSLVESPFNRKKVEHEAYLTTLIKYIHFNPQKHGFVPDFRDYAHSSYQSHLHDKPTKLSRKQVIAWFGNNEEYKLAHQDDADFSSIKNLIIEF